MNGKRSELIPGKKESHGILDGLSAGIHHGSTGGDPPSSRRHVSALISLTAVLIPQHTWKINSHL